GRPMTLDAPALYGSDRAPKMRILVIEDDQGTASYLVKGLSEAGHVADLASDGEEGLALAREGVHDVLVVDRMLPKLDGLKLIEILRAEGIRTPVLILSALGDVDDRVQGLRAGRSEERRVGKGCRYGGEQSVGRKRE